MWIYGLLSGGHDEYGWTCAHDAAEGGHADFIAFLAAHGADLNAEHPWGATPLHLAAEENHLAAAEMLITHGAEINTAGTFGRYVGTPLHSAIWCAGYEMIELLVTHGGDVNARDRNGVTCFCDAAVALSVEIIQLLIAHGADAGALNSNTRTALDYAFDFAFADVVELLGGDVADPNLGPWAPYTVIVEDRQKIRRFLRFEGIEYDEAWIPKPADIEGLDDVLRTCLEHDVDFVERTWVDSVQLLANFRCYDREYGGFLEGGSRYIICNMIFFGGLEGSAFIPGSDAPGSDFTIVYDGGCGVVRVVFDVEKKTVVMIQCNGWA
ncbi:MAG: ankyrin repeat domain-containing protein [Sedimentisphaerales bacterium]|nr:ankyrin repeat domain-containing protein [Sedimentisphaerales bacterium]